MTPILDYGRCFLRHPYEHNVKLQNDTDLSAKYDLLPQQVDNLTPIIYSGPRPKVRHIPSSISYNLTPIIYSGPRSKVRHISSNICYHGKWTTSKHLLLQQVDNLTPIIYSEDVFTAYLPTYHMFKSCLILILMILII